MAKYRIMVINDDDDARRMLTVVLRRRHEVVEARDGLDAMSKLESHEPDLAIIDVMMPMMDGYQVCQSIRRHPRFKNVPVIFLSAHGSKQNVKKSYDVGGNLFMTKPVGPERVLKNIDFTIEHDRPPLKVKQHTVGELAELERQQKAAEEEPPLSKDEIPVQAPPPDVEVPVEPIPRSARPAVAAETAPTELMARVLVVDDDEETRKMLDLTLRGDFEVAMAANGIEAIERMVDYEPDLMLIDIMMPRMNGYQLLQSIRRNQYSRALPVIVLSVKSSAKDREYAERLGANAYLAKPYQIDDLLDTLDKVIRAPGFEVRPKQISIEKIKQREADEQHSQRERARVGRRERENDELREVLRDGGEDPFAPTR